MNLSSTTRRAMLNTAKEILFKLEQKCQEEYDRIERFQKEIEKSQIFLSTRLEPEYLLCKKLVEDIPKKKRLN